MASESDKNDSVPQLDTGSSSTGQQSKDQASDLEEQQRLAQNWQPDVHGPFVSEIQPLEDILKEFDPADPRIVKIKNLAKDYPYFRRMKGDGSCGWRALFFGFLSNLCQAFIEGGHDPQKFLEVVDRHVKSMQDRGYTEMIFEDWVDTVRQTVYTLSDVVRARLDDGKGDVFSAKIAIANLLTSSFNDSEKNMELIQYIRMATSSWLVSVNPDAVAPFILDGLGVASWCNRNIDPPAAELEDLSMKGAFDAFMEQAGMDLVIHDLEAGDGDKVQVYTHTAEQSGTKSNGSKPPSLHVLYRPGHYDLLLQEAWN